MKSTDHYCYPTNQNVIKVNVVIDIAYKNQKENSLYSIQVSFICDWLSQRNAIFNLYLPMSRKRYQCNETSRDKLLIKKKFLFWVLWSSAIQ